MGIIEALAIEAKKEGRHEGRHEGRRESRLEIAKNLITQSSLSDQQIASITSVPLNTIKKMRGEAK